MSDAREVAKEIIDRLLADMERKKEIVTVPLMNYDRMEFNWRKVNSIHQGLSQ